jgi:hypothetical protein
MQGLFSFRRGRLTLLETPPIFICHREAMFFLLPWRSPLNYEIASVVSFYFAPLAFGKENLDPEINSG